MKIYTKTGDKGETSLFGGQRVPKYHLRIDAYGTVDELNSYLGVIRSHHISPSLSRYLLQVQNELFTIGSMLATPPDKETLKNGNKRLQIPTISLKEVQLMESEIDKLEMELPEMTHFILPGGTLSVSFCHVARCICRRAERLIVLLHSEEPVDELILAYFNRLSDYLFVLARKLTFDNQAEEIPWIPTKAK